MTELILVIVILSCCLGLVSDVLYWRVRYTLIFYRRCTYFNDVINKVEHAISLKNAWQLSGTCRELDVDYLFDDPSDWVYEEMFAESECY